MLSSVSRPPCVITVFNRHTHYWNAGEDDCEDGQDHGDDADVDFSFGVRSHGASGKTDDTDASSFQLPRSLADASVKDDQWKTKVWDTLEKAEREEEAKVHKKRPLSSGAAQRQSFNSSSSSSSSSTGTSGFQSAASMLAGSSVSFVNQPAASLLSLPAKLFLHVPLAQREVGLKVLRDAAAQHRDARDMLARCAQWELTAASETNTRQNYNLRIRAFLSDMRNTV